MASRLGTFGGTVSGIGGSAVLDGEASALVVLGPVGLRRNRAVRHEVAGSVVNAPFRPH